MTAEKLNELYFNCVLNAEQKSYSLNVEKKRYIQIASDVHEYFSINPKEFKISDFDSEILKLLFKKNFSIPLDYGVYQGLSINNLFYECRKHKILRDKPLIQYINYLKRKYPLQKKQRKNPILAAKSKNFVLIKLLNFRLWVKILSRQSPKEYFVIVETIGPFFNKIISINPYYNIIKS